MRRAFVAFTGLTLIVAGLVGCGRFSFESREAWRRQAEEACLSAKLVQPTAYMSFASEIDGPGTCGITYPIRTTAFARGDVGLTSRQTLACPIIPEIDSWLARTVQPAAELYFGQRVVDLRAGSYSCRSRNHRPGAKMSEHSFGNALDVMAFRLSDGREITIKSGWRGRPDEQDFLREVFIGACRHFTTVLGPGSDMFHYDHFHLDLARHDPAGRRRVCRPVIKFDPRLDPGTAAVRARPSPVPNAARAERPALPAADPARDPFGQAPRLSSRMDPMRAPGPDARVPAAPPRGGFFDND
ncbi:extensin family protein [Enterovirga rhinocerotis]|uniref:Extensin-like protein n=1 Tax=Enterovirga rhinocerotis TaxID=1339210 RepID=A0A4V3DYP6_9HYPH|nr:extensin family protein [Enterovirga rhinocerotis]TDR93439.1 extensin-like protein [Enterovirga rhinocerotis]